MKKYICLIVWLALVTGMVLAAPSAQTFSLSGASVTITNLQNNSVWIPSVVLWKFTTATNATLTVNRISQGNTFLLGNLAATNASTVIWIAEAEYPFEFGDAFQVTSTVTNGQVQIIRK